MSEKLEISKDRPEPVQRTVVIQGPDLIPASPQRILWGSTLSYREQAKLLTQPRDEIEIIYQNFQFWSQFCKSRL